MPLWAQDVLVACLFVFGGGGYAFLMYRQFAKCEVPGCWFPQARLSRVSWKWVCRLHYALDEAQRPS